jgi:hypothetical protein
MHTHVVVAATREFAVAAVVTLEVAAVVAAMVVV